MSLDIIHLLISFLRNKPPGSYRQYLQLLDSGLDEAIEGDETYNHAQYVHDVVSIGRCGTCATSGSTACAIWLEHT